MIRINTDGPQGPEYDAWLVRAVKRRTKDIATWRAGGKLNPSQRLWSELKRIFLEKLFSGKCAYCEVKAGPGFDIHVEHYRPKLSVTEERQQIDHPGYFWLAYEWHNLILACAHCNSPHSGVENDKNASHEGKSNEFRIAGQRVSEPSGDPSLWREELKVEQPLLLNPYVDEPHDHLEFDDKGFLKHKTERGSETIEVCHLNRTELVDARIGEQEKVAARLNEAMYKIGDGPYFSTSDTFSAWLNHCVTLKLIELAGRAGYRLVSDQSSGETEDSGEHEKVFI